MNKIYKVMYSKVKQCAVVVSEIAKSHGHNGESSSVRKHAALMAAVLIALGSLSIEGMPVAQADANAHNNDFIGANDYYWYWDKKDNKWQQNTYRDLMVGHLPRKDLPNNEGAGAKETGSIAAGLYAQAGQQTITIGNRNEAQSRGSVFIGEHSGYDNKTSNPPSGMHDNYVTSVGFQSDATGWGSIAIGSNATAKNTKKTDVAVTMTGNTDEDKKNGIYEIEKNPMIEGASVALGYSAEAHDGNIAIGAYSEATTDLSADTSEKAKSYLTGKNATSYVSVGSSDVQRRISNVADGAAATDVATVGQLQELSKELGGYKAGFGITIATDSTDKTKNTISLDRNLGTNYTDKKHKGDEKVTVNVNDTGLVLGGYAEDAGGNKNNPEVTYGATGDDSVTVGGKNGLASGRGSVAAGGMDNVASGINATVVGGEYNNAAGTQAAVLGGLDNTASGTDATASGGSYNVANGIQSAVLGGYSNNALGTGTTSIGGYGKAYDGQNNVIYDSSVNGMYSVGIAGGSTGKDAGYALAAGNQAVATVENGTAIGYQATTDEANTIAFGHDAGDVSGYTIKWKQRTDGKTNADGTTNDYTQAPESVVAKDPYTKAGYNRLVKVADGVDAHDVVVMEQLDKAKTELTKGLSVNAGWGINIEDVTTKDENGKEMTKKNVISLKRNLGKNYGSRYGTGKVNFEADGENSLILGGGALNDSWEDRDKEVTYGAHGKDSILVGGLNNDIAKDSEKVATNIGTKASIGTRAVIIGGTSNTVSYDPVTEKDPDTGKEKVKVDSNGNVIVQTQKTGTDAIIVGGLQNTAKGDGSVLIGGESNEATGFYSTVIGGTSNKTDGWLSSIFGGTKNTITGAPTAAGIFGGTGNTINSNGIAANVFGGENNTADNTLAVVVGGEANTSSGPASIILGGNHNTANQLLATVVGGQLNTATGETSMISGGIGNVTSGRYSYASGGLYNNATGIASSALGGRSSSVNGMFSTGVAGGSTGQDAFFSLAAGYKSVVADSGVEKTFITGDDSEKIQEDMEAGKELSGFYMGDPSDMPELGHTGTLIHYDKFSTALGYQATANKPGTISFGHDAGDESGYTYEWETLTDEKGNPKQNEIDGTTNDYTKAPKSVKKKAPYTSAYYNRLVKVADGIDDHDVVVMEQLKQYAEKDASNLGNNIKVYKTDANGNVQLDKDKKPIEDTDATTTAQNGSKDAWGKALGADSFTAGSATTVTDASTSDQLVTGKTLYDYDKPTGSTNYVKVNNTTGQNLSALDAQVKANADELDKPNHNIKFYAVDDKILKYLPKVGTYSNNEANDGAKGMGSMAAGVFTHSDGIASTVAGSYSGVLNQNGNGGLDLRGATALSYGTFNVNQNTDATKVHSGVANSIIGQVNMTKNSNAAIIYGAGNIVTDSYRPIDEKKAAAILGSDNNPDQLGEAMKDAVESSGGQVMVMGGGNNVESAYMTQVVGVGNTVKGNQVYTKDAKTGEWNWTTDTNEKTAIKDYDSEKSSQYNYVDGFSNEVINGKHDYVIGANNKLSGDSYDDSKAQPIKRSNRSNIVIGDNHTLTREQNTVIIGSSDTENTQTKARDAVIIGHNANATNDDTGADNAVAIGRSAKATGGNAVTIGVNTSAGAESITIGSESSADPGSNIAIGRSVQVYGYKITNAVALGVNTKALVSDGVAIGSESQATVKGNSAEGYDPVTGKDSTDEAATWKATKAAVSIGTADGTVTRQINGLAAGTNDTDAVNVAQLKKLEGMKANVDASNIGANLKGSDGKTAASASDITANEDAWGTAIGTGTIASTSGQLVTGKTVYSEVRPTADGTYIKTANTTAANLTALDTQVGTNTGDITNLKDLSNISNKGETVIKNLAKNTVKVKAGERVTVTDKTDSTTGAITYTVSANNNGAVAAGDTNLVSGDTVNTAITNAINNAGTETDTKLAGKANVDASNIGANLKGSDGKTAASASDITANEDAWGTAIGTGTIASTSGQLVTGKTVYSEVRPTADGTYIKTANTTAANLTALDTQVGRNTTNISNLQNGEGFTDKGNTYIKNLAKGSIGMENGSHTTVSHRDANGVETYKVDVNVDGKVESGNKGIVDGGTVYNAIQDVKTKTSADLANKANVDASNLSDENVKSWQEKLGNGKVESGNTGLVTGETVFKAVDTKANRDGSNLTDKEADSFSEKIARGEVKAGENRAVSGDAVSQAISKVTGDMNTKLDGKANTSLDNITDTGKNVIRDLAKGSVKVIDGTNTTVTTVEGKGEKPTTYAVNVEGKGTVTSGNTGLISGGTAFTELRPADGSYVKQSNTTATNLTALDTQLKTTSDLIHTAGDTIQIGGNSTATKIDVSGKDANGNTTGRVITGVVSDANDPNSAANVGYVNGLTAANTQQIYRDMNNAYGRLNNNINKAAAGSNALAALHPLDYDPDDKADFAVGYGHYRNANAAAVGAFYHPNENTMVNVGVSLGNGDPGFNAGVSFKIGSGSAGREAMSKTEMAKVINSQSKEIDALKKDNADKDKRIDALEQKMAEILAKLDKNGK